MIEEIPFAFERDGSSAVSPARSGHAHPPANAAYRPRGVRVVMAPIVLDDDSDDFIEGIPSQANLREMCRMIRVEPIAQKNFSIEGEERRKRGKRPSESSRAASRRSGT